MRTALGSVALLLACTALVLAQCSGGACYATPTTTYYYPSGVTYYYSPPVYLPPPVVLPPQSTPVPVEEPKKEEPEKKVEAAPMPPPGCEDGCKIEHTTEDQEGPTLLNFGVDLAQLGKEPRYRVNGKEVSRQEAIAAIEDSRIPDDANLIRLTLIGSKEDRQRVMHDLDTHPGLKHLRSNLLVQGYDADDPRVAKRGFVCSGKPSIYLLDPSGKVLARNTDGEYPGAEAFAFAVGEVVGKPYTPDADKPLPKKPEPQPIAIPKTLSEVPQWAWIAGAAAVFLYLNSRNKGGVS